MTIQHNISSCNLISTSSEMRSKKNFESVRFPELMLINLHFLFGATQLFNAFQPTGLVSRTLALAQYRGVEHSEVLVIMHRIFGMC